MTTSKSWFFEDFEVGQRFESRGVTFTQSMIIEFALKYDPQPIHIDVPAAEEGTFNGLIASGFQSLALTFRLFWDLGVMADCGLGAPGIDDLRWHRPVRPGDTLKTTAQVKAVRASSSKPDRGSVRMAYSGHNQHGEMVISFEVSQIMRRKGTSEKT